MFESRSESRSIGLKDQWYSHYTTGLYTIIHFLIFLIQTITHYIFYFFLFPFNRKHFLVLKSKSSSKYYCFITFNCVYFHTLVLRNWEPTWEQASYVIHIPSFKSISERYIQHSAYPWQPTINARYNNWNVHLYFLEG